MTGTVPGKRESGHLSGRYLAKAHPTNGVVFVSGHTCLDIQVSPESLDQAHRIFDALIKALEAAALKVEVAVVDPRKGDYAWEPKLYEHVPTGELASMDVA